MTTTLQKLGANTLYLILSLLLVLTIFYYWLDIPIIEWVANNVNNTLLTDFSNVFAELFRSSHWTLLAIFAGISGLYFHYVRHNAKKSQALFFFATSILLTTFICFIIKFGLARYRPYELLNHGLYGFHFLLLKNAANSMPSGHASSSFAGLFAIACICHRRWLTTILMLLAVIIALTRVILLQHYPSDIIFGTAIGIMVVYWVRALIKYPASA